MQTLNIINPSDRGSGRYKTQAWILHFGAYLSKNCLVYADHLEDAFDIAVDWIAENAPGLLMDDQVEEAYKEAIAEGKCEERAREIAEMDMTIAGNCGHYVASWEWGITECPTREQIKAYDRIEVCL